MKARNEKRYLIFAVYVIFAVFYFWMAAQIPYTHDDWDWGLDNGLTQLLTASINSRYAGNFFVVLMTRSEIAKVIIMGSCYFLVPYLISRLISRNVAKEEIEKRAFYFLMANLLLLLMDREVWRQTYGWVSGFANYVISAVFLLINLLHLVQTIEKTGSAVKHRNFQIASTFISFFIGQLFLENLAIFMVCITAATSLIVYIQDRRITLDTAVALAGTLLGLLIMFSSNIYGVLWNTGAAVGGARQLVWNTNSSFVKNVLACCVQLVRLLKRGGEEQLILSGGLLLYLAYRLVKRGNSSRVEFCFAALNIMIVVYFAVFNIFNLEYTKLPGWISLIGAAVNLAYYAVVTLEIVFLLWRHKKKMIECLVTWFCAILILAPLAITTECGPRVYYVANVFVIILGLTLFANYVGEAELRMRKKEKVLLMIAIAAMLTWYTYVYAGIGAVRTERIELIQNKIAEGADEIIIPAYPFDEYLWEPNPKPDAPEREVFFKEFYGIPAEINLVFE